MKKISDIWKFLDGKKTIIGAALYVIIWILRRFRFAQEVPDEVWQWIQDIITGITGAGLAHKTIKRYGSNKKSITRSIEGSN